MDMVPNGPLAHLVRACFRGEPGPDALTDLGRRGVLDSLDRHGLSPLLAARLADRLDGEPRERLDTARRHLIAQEVIWDEQLARVMDALAARDIPVLIFKGQGLCHTHYPEAGMRTRCDMDLLIRPEDRAAVADVLTSTGYEASTAATGEHTLTQTMFSRDIGGLMCVFDVHWQVSNRPGLAGVFGFDDLMARSVPVNGLPHQRCPGTVDALLLACAHRAGHHAHEDRWIWLYDVHLLCSQLSEQDWARFVEVAQRAALGGLCRETLDSARSLFGTALDPAAMDALEGDTDGLEYLKSGRLDQWRVDAAGQPARQRVSWAREHLFPSPAYMRERYGKGGVWLPFLYMYRALRGFGKLFR